MDQDYRVPVERVFSKIRFINGNESEATLFVPPGQDVSEFLESSKNFIPLEIDGEIHLSSSRAFLYIDIIENSSPSVDSINEFEELPLDEPFVPPNTEYRVRVYLTNGMQFDGTIKTYQPVRSLRTIDVLNLSEKNLVLLTEQGTTRYVPKNLIQSVREVER